MSESPVYVLNADGRDPEQSFASGIGGAESSGHAPVNYHAYAACTGGCFFQRTTKALGVSGPVILLARGDLRACVSALRELKASGRRVWIACKEAGRHQVAALLADRVRFARFRDAVHSADGFLASTPWLVPFVRSLGAARAEFVPTPYPLGEPGWDLSRPIAERAGIFVGTREFDVPSRNHLSAVISALALGRAHGCGVTVFCVGGRSDRALLREIEPDPDRLRLIEGKLPYAAYLRVMAGHRIVYQHDRSGVPGQVAGDALLTGTPCVGGDGAVEGIAFPDLCGSGRDVAELEAIAGRLLGEDGSWGEAVDAAAGQAAAQVSFRAVAPHLRAVLGG